MPPSFVVLTNLSPAAEKMVRYAAALGVPLSAQLALVHVYHDRTLLAPELAVATTVQTNRHYAEAVAGVQALVRGLPGPAEGLVSVAPLPDAVAQAVWQYQPLLLVMGLSPEHTMVDALLHNQLLPVLRATRRPLLLVPAAATTTSLPRRVLLALDAEPFHLAAATRKLTSLLATWPAAYTLTHVETASEQKSHRSRNPLPDVHASGLLPPGAPLELYQPTEVAPAAGILQAITDTQADLLILLARPRSFLGQLFHRSITAQVLRHAQVPVLLVPAEAPELPGWMPAMS